MPLPAQIPRHLRVGLVPRRADLDDEHRCALDPPLRLGGRRVDHDVRDAVVVVGREHAGLDAHNESQRAAADVARLVAWAKANPEPAVGLDWP